MRPVAGSQLGSVVAVPAACAVAADDPAFAVVVLVAPAAPVVLRAAPAAAPPAGVAPAVPAALPPGGATVTSTWLLVVGAWAPSTGVDCAVPNWPALVET